MAYEEWRDLYLQGKLNSDQEQFFKPRPAEALYDVEADPFELNNLAKDKEYREVLLTMRAAMREQVQSMPDLSFIPEPVLYNEAANNPVAYGQKNKKRISALVNLADMSLRPLEKGKKFIDKAIASKDPLRRYWAMILCSSFG